MKDSPGREAGFSDSRIQGLKDSGIGEFRISDQ